MFCVLENMTDCVDYCRIIRISISPKDVTTIITYQILPISLSPSARTTNALSRLALSNTDLFS